MPTDELPPPANRKKDLLFFLLFLVLFLFTFRDFFFARRVFFERDTSIVEIPSRRLTVDLLKEGNFALWTDAHGNGQPFLANPKHAVLYPATLLYLLLPLFTAFRLYYLIHVVLGWLGLYALCRSYALSEKAAFLGASLFAFSGMYLSSFEFYNHIAAAAWMPWVLLLLHRGMRAPSGRSRFVPLTLLWTLLILAGSPEILVLTALFAAAQAFLKPGEWGKRLTAAGLTFIAAGLLTAVQLLPSAEMLARTGRQAQTLNWPLELLQLPEMTFPGVLGNDREPGHQDYWGWHLFDKHFPLYYSLYMGFGALVLALFAIRRPWDRKRKVLLGVSAVFFLLACGRYSPFFFLYRMTPFLSSIRYPVKFFLGSVFCLSILAGAGLDDVTAARPPGRKGALRLAAAAGLALGLFLLLKGPVISLVNALLVIEKDASLRALGRSITEGLVFLALYAAVFAVLSLTRARGAALAWVLAAAAVLDPAYHNRWINPTVPESFYDRPPILAGLGPPVTVYRAEDYFLDRREKSGSNIRFLAYYRRSLYPLTAMADGVRYVFNVDFFGTYPRTYVELLRAARRLPPEGQRKILESLGCQYYISDAALFESDSARRLEVEGFPLVIEEVAKNRAVPSVVYGAMSAADSGARLRIFTSPEFDPGKNLLTDKDIGLPGPGAAGGPPAPGAVAVLEEHPGRGRYSAELSRRGAVVFPGSWAPGWRAWVDGKRVEVFEANLFAKGVLVPAGTHGIVLRYLPWSFVCGAAVSLATAAGLLAALVRGRVRLRRKARRASV